MIDLTKLPFKYQLLIICILVGVAWWFIGDVALAGFLALFFGRKNKKEDIAHKLNDEADEHIKMADHHVGVAVQAKKTAEKIQDKAKAVAETPVDYEKPIKEVVDDAKKDWD